MPLSSSGPSTSTPSLPKKKKAQESLIAFRVHENALQVSGNQFQPSQNFYRCKRVISLFPSTSIQ